MQKANALVLATFLSTTALGGVAHASSSFGVVAIVQSMELRPDSTNPSQVVLYGYFALAVPGQYGTPQGGHMFYQCPFGESANCKMQWSDINKNLNKCIGFGARYDQNGGTANNGTVRPSGTPANPDTLQLGMGVMAFTGNEAQDVTDACTALRDAINKAPDMAMAADMATAPDLTMAATVDLATPGSGDLAYPLVKAPREDPSGCAVTSAGSALGSAAGAGALGLGLVGGLVVLGLARRRRR